MGKIEKGVGRDFLPRFFKNTELVGGISGLLLADSLIEYFPKIFDRIEVG